MRFYWLLPSFLGVFLFALPAQAGKLVSSRFDPNLNRLVFTTDDGVQPKAMLLSNPTRVVIELPGITLDRPTVRQQFRGVVREFRVGQKDDRTTSLVIELIPGYTLDPQKVLIRGDNPAQWSVQLPRPERGQSTIPSNPGNLPPLNPLPPSAPPLGRPQSRTPVIFTSASSGISILNFQVTRDGFFLRTSGSNPVMRVSRDRDRQTINVDIEGATLASGLIGKDFLVNRFGVRNVQFTQVQSSTPSVRMTLNVTENSPNWRAFFSSLGGIVLLPQGGTIAAQLDTPPPRSTSSPSSSSQLATIESVDLASNGNLLLIRADRPIRPTATWERATGTYRISIANAQLASRVRGPQLYSNSPIFRVRLQQVGSRLVDILVQPASGVRVGTLSRISDQLISLQLIRSSPLFSSPGPDSQTTIPVPPPRNDEPPTTSLPPVRSGRVTVLIDPGHGGYDSGAPGIGGILEKDIVLSVSRKVEAILRQSGVQVVMTRDSDYFVTLPGRVAAVPRVGADVFVSIHANSINNRPDVNGLEVYYFGPAGERLARTIHRSIIQNVGINDRGVRRARFYVLRKNSVPATLVELGFVTSPSEIRRLASPAYQNQMAAAIARGIIQFIRQNY